MAPPKDIARSYPKRGLTADVGFRSEPKFCGDGSTEFDGSADKVTAAHYNPSGDFLTTTAWVNADTLRVQGMIHNGNTGRNSFLFVMNDASGNADFYWNDTTGDARIRHQTQLAAARWYHLAAVMDMSDPADHQVTFYIDGIAATGTRTSAGWVGDNTYQFGNQYASTGWFDGKIANCRIYDAALTQDQIRELYNNPGLDFPSGLTTSNLRRHYKLETDFNDSGADSENATASGSPSFTVDRPQLPRGLDLARGAAQARVYTGRAVDFDGSADRLTAAHYNPSGDYLTTTVWFNADTIRNQGITHNGNLGRNSFLFYMGSSNNIQFYWNDTTGDALITHQSSLNAGQWHHLAMVLDMSDPADYQATCYIDGIAATGTRTSASWVGDNTYQFGNQYATFGWFDGKIADCRIYDVALTQAQIRELYHNPEQVLPTGVSASNLRRYYPLSDYNDTGGTGGRYFQDMGADGEPAEDKGSALMAFAQPVPCPQLGLQQSATRLFFSGGTQGATATITAPGTTVSFSAWVFWDQARTSYAINIGDVVSTSGDGFQIRINASGQITMYQRDGGGVNQELLSGLTVTEGEWNHIVVATRSDSPYWRCWLNNSEASSPNALVNTVNVTSTNCNLGMNNYNFGMAGIANDAAVWNTELGDSDVAALYNSGVQGMDVSTVQSANLLGWWKFDDLTTLKDYSGNGANATVTGTFAAASFPENASGSTIVGDFSMKRKGVSILNINNDQGYAYALGQDKPSYFPKAGATGYSMSVAHRPIKMGTFEILWGNDAGPLSTPGNDQFILAMQVSGAYTWSLGDGSSRPQVSTSTGTADGEWHILTLTIDYSVSPARWTTYVDGIQSTTGTASISGPPGNIYEVSFGRWYSGGYKGSSASGCYRFYDVALSADEVERLAFSDLRLIKGLNNE